MGSNNKPRAIIATMTIGILLVVFILVVSRLMYKYTSLATPATLTRSNITALPSASQALTSLKPFPSPTNTREISLPTFPSKYPVLIHNEIVSPDSLARIVGGNARYWRQQFSSAWIYNNEGYKTLFHHPGENMIWFYVIGDRDLQDADDCQTYDSHVNNGSGMVIEYVKCPSGTNAWIESDSIGLMLVDITGYFH